MRLFVALLPPAEVLAELADAIEALRSDHEEVRWVAPGSWHVTLAFLGQVGEERVPELTERLRRAASRHPAPTLTVSRGGRFDGRALWVGVTGDRQRLKRLAGSVAAAARRTGIPLEDRPLRAHITLARVRGKEPVDLRPLVAALAGYAGTPWTPGEIHLVRSHLGAEVRHESLGAWPLKPAPAEPG